MTDFDDNVADIKTELDDATVAFAVGRLELAKNRQRRRLVWVETPGQIGPPGTIGGGNFNNVGAVVGSRARPIYTLESEFECHVFAESRDTTWTLFKNLLGAIHAVVATDVQFDGYEWVTETEASAAFIKRQHVIVVRGLFRLVVTDESQALAEIQRIDTTKILEADTDENVGVLRNPQA